MKTTGNTILITGGGSGIGRGLAEAFHKRGNTVIITGRRREMLDETTRANPGMLAYALDVDNAKAVTEFAAMVTREHPKLNVLVNNAGIMRQEKLETQTSLADAEATITTNLIAPLRLTTALLPHLLKQTSAAVVNVTSGLAFVPLVSTPTYSATKAALHSYSISLRKQLEKTSVEVIELAPPAVATDLVPGHRENPHSMPLQAYIDESMALFEKQNKEVLVENVKFLRFAEASGSFDKVFGMLNP